MEDTGKIHVYITNKLPSGITGISGDTGQEQEKEKKSYAQTLTDFAKHKFFNMVESEAKTVANYQLSNIGNFTGNYQAQREINTTMSIVGDLISIGTAAYAGFKVAGAPGAIIGASVGVIGKGVNFYLQEKSNHLQFNKQQREIDIMRERSGLNTLTNGNRTGI